MRNHLAEDTYRRLLAGTLPPAEARALAEHLRGDCPVCEAFLAARPAADALDGRADHALGSLRPGDAADAGNDLEFRRIQRRLARAPRLREWRGLGLAAAALVLVAGLAALEWADRRGPLAPGWDGEKGFSSRAVPVRLRFVVLDPAGGIEKGVAGEAVGAGARLQFELELGRAADVALVRVPARGAPEVFLRERLAPGRTTVSLDGRPAAYPLDGLAGPQRFLAIASPGPLDERSVLAAAAGLAPPARISPDAPGLEGLSLDAVEVVVRER
ncbi:DUF4384 domain-containing protein [Anaeromyxobacter oryzae]|uniref:Zinc-finger domain-containing protein n=1 Tax=Anaeromyxobacter oryzae TaxID=2918170 RepID=A0ABM7WQB5_9BACT|nr:DUF4384 domain-containing protein [Anaeromyxobacter oryzae]BDG01650.1 hypothetical protein AMOR_06460 [Anaeromyxobacter oryzae]